MNSFDESISPQSRSFVDWGLHLVGIPAWNVSISPENYPAESQNVGKMSKCWQTLMWRRLNVSKPKTEIIFSNLLMDWNTKTRRLDGYMRWLLKGPPQPSPSLRPKAVMGGGCIEVSSETNSVWLDAPGQRAHLEERPYPDVFIKHVIVSCTPYDFKVA